MKSSKKLRLEKETTRALVVRAGVKAGYTLPFTTGCTMLCGGGDGGGIKPTHPCNVLTQ